MFLNVNYFSALVQGLGWPTYPRISSFPGLLFDHFLLHFSKKHCNFQNSLFLSKVKLPFFESNRFLHKENRIKLLIKIQNIQNLRQSKIRLKFFFWLNGVEFAYRIYTGFHWILESSKFFNLIYSEKLIFNCWFYHELFVIYSK